MSGQSAFGPQQAYSVFEAMRPGPGLSVDRMVCFTYSLDLVAVTAMLISMTGQVDDELEGGPMCLADALGTLGTRLVIMYQKGRLQAARRHFGILHLLDGVLHAVTPRPGASWHPKCVLARYAGDDGGIGWRLWVGSRNLTVSTDREAGILLCGMPSKKGRRIPAVAEMVRSLARPVAWPEAVLTELADLRWASPPGTRFRELHWRGLGARKPFIAPLQGALRTIVISPFVNAGGLNALAARGANPAIELVTIPPTADALGERAGVTMRVGASPQPDAPAAVPGRDGSSETEAPEPIRQSGLHAKLILQRSRSTNRLWIGSANTTGRGLVAGNVEVTAEIDVDDTIAGTLEAFAEAQELATASPRGQEAVEIEAAERALDEELQAVLDADFTLATEDGTLHLTVGGDLDAFLATNRLEAWPFTYPDAPVEWPAGARRITLRTEPVPLRLQTSLVGFRASPREGPDVRRAWAQKVGFPDLNVPARDRAATAAYIGMSNLAAWLRARLQGIEPVETRTWTGADRRGGAPGAGDGPGGLATFALEEVLAAWARNPGQFEARAAATSDVLDGFASDLAERDDEESEDARRQLEEIEAFWSAVRGCLGSGKKHGA